MKELMKNYKVWLIASLTLLIMLAAVCISFSGNYHELESYREKEYNAAEQQKVISKLTEENTKLKTENTSVQSADSLTEMIQEYVKNYYNSDGTESENEKALKVRKYVTDELFEQMYDKSEKPESYAPDELIRRDRKKNEIESSFASSRTIAVAGSQHRIGTTTQALQIVKHLILEGHTACYIQLNSSDYVQKVGEFYTDAILNEDTGLVTYLNLEMYYKQERIADILAKNYDYYIYDFGCISDKEFTLVQFLEKDIRIAVCGSKANELPYIQSVLELMNTSTAEYIFSFTGEADCKDILELMEDKQKHTFFSGYIPDPLSYSPSSKEIYSAIIKPEKAKESDTPKHRFRLFGRRKKG